MSPLPAISNPAARRTASDDVADALRDAIVSGQLGDNEELNQVELARHFGVSRVPVREALRRLEAEGLVVAEAHRRVVVQGLTPDRVAEIFEIRALLEGFMLERSAPNLTAGDFQALGRVIDKMDAVKDHGKWLALNHDFHNGLLARSDTPTAVSVVERLSHQVERYLRRSGGVERNQEVGREHRAVLEAVESGDTEKAVELLREHILATRDIVFAGSAETAASGA